jgi:hypothetical protein
MDCPPALNMLTVNGLVAADSGDDSDAVRVLRAGRPDRPRRDAEEGARHLNPVLEIEGLLRTMFDPRSTLTQQVSRELEAISASKVYRTIIPRNVRLAEAPSYGKPVIAFDRSSKGAQAYLLLAQEMLDRRAGKAAGATGDWEQHMKLKGLGRGLDALLAGNDAQSKEQQRTLPVARLQPGKYQPRTHGQRPRSKSWRRRSGCRG